MANEELLEQFERTLEDNHQRIVERRQALIEKTGRSMPVNRTKYLRKLAVERLRAGLHEKEG